MKFYKMLTGHHWLLINLIRKNIFIFFILGMCNTVTAQDILVTNEGESMKVYNLDIGGSAIFYQLENKTDAALQKMEKSRILIIKRADGSKLDFNEPSIKNVMSEVPQVISTRSAKELGQIEMKNLELIDKYNNNKIIYLKPKNKIATCYFITMGIKKGSILYNGDITINYNLGSFSYRDNKFSEYKNDTYSWLRPMFTINIKNNTNKTIYIDLGNTFVIRNEEASPYYIPTATSSTKTGSTGVGVNLGAIAGAVNIGGTLGHMANGVNVGGGTSSSTTDITYSQRVIAIPPMSSKKLAPMSFILDNQEFVNGLFSKLVSGYGKNIFGYYINNKELNIPDIEIGDTHTLFEENNPVKFGTFISYSFDENCSNLQNIKTEMYLKDIIGTGSYKRGFFQFFNPENMSTNWTETFTLPCFKTKH